MHHSLSDVYSELQIHTLNCLCDSPTWKPPRHLRLSMHTGLMFILTYLHTHTPYSFSLFLVNGITIYSAGQARNLGVILDVSHSLIPQPNIHHLMVLSISWFCLPLPILCCQAHSSPVLDYSTNLLTDHHQQLPPCAPFSGLESPEAALLRAIPIPFAQQKTLRSQERWEPLE